MKPTDFGVDLDALPKLKFDEDAGRKALERMRRIPVFAKTVKYLKQSYFHHHLSHHLDVDVGDVKLSDINGIEKVLIPRYPLIWEQVSRVIDRHIFMMVAMFHSFEANIEDKDDMEAVNCHVYDEFVSVPVFGLLLGDAQMMGFAKISRSAAKSGDISTFLEYIFELKQHPSSLSSMIKSVTQEYILSAMEEKSTYENAYKDD